MVKKKSKYKVTVDATDVINAFDHAKKLVIQLKEVVNRLTAIGIKIDCEIDGDEFVRIAANKLKIKSVRQK